MATQPRPTLHEIAAMPFPASQEAMRKHYDANWHRDLPEADENGKRLFRVRFDWSLEGEFDAEVEATDEAEAEDIAREQVCDDYYSGDLNISYLKVTSADPKEIAVSEAYAQAMSTGTAKTPKAVEGRSPASAVPQGCAPTPPPSTTGDVQ